MKFNFIGDIDGLSEGISYVSRDMGFEVSEKGVTVEGIKIDKKELNVKRVDDKIMIEYSEPVHFFRGIGIAIEHISEKSFNTSETVWFDTNGIMLDMTQGNDAVNVDNIKIFLDKMAIMGLNSFYLYIEDNYDFEGEPYFGYCRSRYTKEELKEMDRYAGCLGIKIIPCIQTLAHLSDTLKWYPYAEMIEDGDTLLVGEEKVYVFIENMIKTIRSCFSHNKIHIGMDEAFKLGQGEYLKQNGYQPVHEIMKKHMSRVMEICKRSDIDPMIWADMYLRAANGNPKDPFIAYYKLDGEVPQGIIDEAPPELDYIYWDYYHNDEKTYDILTEKHRAFSTKDIIFAGGIWNWYGFTVDYDKTFENTLPALASMKKKGVRNVFATTWGDGGAERNIYSILLGMQLYAELGFHKDISNEHLAKRFKVCTGCEMDDFMELTYLDNAKGAPILKPEFPTNTSRYAMWQDILCGLMDYHIAGQGMEEQYIALTKYFEKAKTRNGKFNFMFEYYQVVASALSIKAEIGIKIKDAYDLGDKDTLKYIIKNTLPELKERIETLRKLQRENWFKINKPFGYEVLDLRYGAILTRIDTAIWRIEEYLKGNIITIEELDEVRRSFDGTEGLTENIVYHRIFSSSKISFLTSL